MQTQYKVYAIENLPILYSTVLSKWWKTLELYCEWAAWNLAYTYTGLYTLYSKMDVVRRIPTQRKLIVIQRILSIR